MKIDSADYQTEVAILNRLCKRVLYFIEKGEKIPEIGFSTHEEYIKERWGNAHITIELNFKHSTLKNIKNTYLLKMIIFSANESTGKMKAETRIGRGSKEDIINDLTKYIANPDLLLNEFIELSIDRH